MDRDSNILQLIKWDAFRLLEKIENRKDSYLFIFSAKRERSHFREVFSNKFDKVNLDLLTSLSSELVFKINKFYHLADDLKWYLNYTQDMPEIIDDHLQYTIARMRNAYEEIDTEIAHALNVENPSYVVDESKFTDQ